MKKFKITIKNAGQPVAAEIGMLCDSLEEAEMAYEVIKSQTFTHAVELTLLGDSGEEIRKDKTEYTPVTG